MIIVAQAPVLLLILFLLAMVAAAVEDLVRRRVSNLAVLAVALSGIAAFLMTGHGLRLWEPLVVAIAILGVGTFLFSRGVLGGGDVKLLAAACFWYSLKGQLTYLAAAFLAGGILALLVLGYRLVVGRAGGGSMKKNSIGIPYAVAIAAGAVWTVITYRLT